MLFLFLCFLFAFYALYYSILFVSLMLFLLYSRGFFCRHKMRWQNTFHACAERAQVRRSVWQFDESDRLLRRQFRSCAFSSRRPLRWPLRPLNLQQVQAGLQEIDVDIESICFNLISSWINSIRFDPRSSLQVDQRQTLAGATWKRRSPTWKRWRHSLNLAFACSKKPFAFSLNHKLPFKFHIDSKYYMNQHKSTCHMQMSIHCMKSAPFIHLLKMVTFHTPHTICQLSITLDLQHPSFLFCWFANADAEDRCRREQSRLHCDDEEAQLPRKAQRFSQRFLESENL